MCEIIANCVYIIIGSLITYAATYLQDKRNNKASRERVVVDLRLKVYSSAISYIVLLARMAEYNTPGTREQYKDLGIMGSELYNDFYPMFSIMVPREKLEKYNQLIDDASEGKIEVRKAYEAVSSIIDYKLLEE